MSAVEGGQAQPALLVAALEETVVAGSGEEGAGDLVAVLLELTAGGLGGDLFLSLQQSKRFRRENTRCAWSSATTVTAWARVA
ncbi:MAG: hypothetical protein SX243_26225, partial [Acidobacteriota bacterium]|nr:hypothetical protein [Acidobacteriota bacterium]